MYIKKNVEHFGLPTLLLDFETIHELSTACIFVRMDMV